MFAAIITTTISAAANENNNTTVTLKVDNKIVNYNITQKADRNIVTYLHNGRFNKIEFDTKNETLNENGMMNINQMSRAPRKQLVKTLPGFINLKSTRNKVEVIASILVITGPKSAAIAGVLAVAILKRGIKKVYYTQYIYRMKNNSPKGKYKYTSTFKFYSDSKRKQHLLTIG